ncbi:DUF1801 domain-containing protein [Algoriphagus sp. AGSA1]|uniref:DUF1801 domain-containing protein n=1 Tax=Algoriphagus sp. AGSA1 TaxID=2907213 RepID=UPI001F263CE6|nr:DUF1801 domain-containing protein [Algoriphagus sp. AGSA1]MCE7053174.1 DUF1801 domain-containing protein [Algoriphagus sp. AGSA1]
MNAEIKDYNQRQTELDQEICDLLAVAIDKFLTDAESKIWHSHPVWFLEGNPIVGFSKQKPGIRLMFWSGAGFEEEALNVRGQKFKDASIFYTSAHQIDESKLKLWLDKAKTIQWDYKNLIKKKGRLDRLK